MKSMTGYGKFSAQSDGRELSVEIKSVNNRYLEINPRLPKALSSQEDLVRKIVKSRLSRGTVDVYFNYADSAPSDKAVKVDEALVAGYVTAARELCEKFGIENDFSVSDAMRIPEAVKIEIVDVDETILSKLVDRALTGACDKLCAFREKEGAGIKKDLSVLADNIETELNKVIERAPEVVTDYKAKLYERVKALLDGVDVDETKLLNEVAFFADKADINEEISRLSSHIAQFRDELDKEEQVGRKLDFLSQEMNREINTMGSKANDSRLTDCVLKMKNELEKIKEQIRNVE
ncbi:MAG: YicC family protein [Firmicutes bacterium]|nr:YicC family protein [Bacillota bacterium]